MVFSTTANSALVFFENDETGFTSTLRDARLRLASFENFQQANVNLDSVEVFDGPLSSSTKNDVFSLGSISSGVSIAPLDRTSFVLANPADPLAILGNGVGGVQSKTVAISNPLGNIETDKISIEFADPQTFVSFNFASIDLRFNDHLDAALLVDLFASATDESSRIGAILLGDDSPTGLDFLGIQSSVPFTRMIIVSLTAYSSPAIDNIRFNTVMLPEPSTLALLGLGLASLAASRRRK